jgi:hypothetical protein
MVALSLAGIALVAQVVMLWRRGTQAHIGWWRRLPLVLPVLWAVICGLLAQEAWGYYRDVTMPFSCPPEMLCSLKGACFAIADLGVETQIALLVAAVALGLGWFALFRINGRRSAG